MLINYHRSRFLQRLLLFQWRKQLSHLCNKFCSQNADIHTSGLGEPKHPADRRVGPSPGKMLFQQYHIVGGGCPTASRSRLWSSVPLCEICEEFASLPNIYVTLWYTLKWYIHIKKLATIIKKKSWKTLIQRLLSLQSQTQRLHALPPLLSRWCCLTSLTCCPKFTIAQRALYCIAYGKKSHSVPQKR